ncbi:hypothetical protein [Jannaschia rubra]|uniref:hypothetical protein n=1 Tax=Jannaschia rubra TaxID=282197 RepID=UPI0024918D90|nr:hypothetical protein [Jannaschia rubra]
MTRCGEAVRGVVIGGTGVFGSRLVAGLRRMPEGRVLVASRSPGGDVVPDRTARDMAQRLSAARPGIVIVAAEPFQAYGDDPYALVRAAIACRP